MDGEAKEMLLEHVCIPLYLKFEFAIYFRFAVYVLN